MMDLNLMKKEVRSGLPAYGEMTWPAGPDSWHKVSSLFNYLLVSLFVIYPTGYVGK